MKKNNKKTVLFVDFTGVQYPEDVYAAVVVSKVNSGMVITPDELNILVDNVMDHRADIMEKAGKLAENMISEMFTGLADAMESAGIVKKKKPNIFKRIWNKIRGKK